MIPYSRPKLSDLYTLSQSKLLENHTLHSGTYLYSPPGGGTLGISGWGCATGTLEPLTYTRASSAKFCYPILE